MQYFLKAALGPNRDLNKIFVFDPELHKAEPKGEALKKRYSECFSSQFRQSIEFEPKARTEFNRQKGTFDHMVNMITHSPDHLLFGLKPNEEKTSHF